MAATGAGEKGVNSVSQSEEVAAIKEANPGRCRIIKDVGAFSHVVTLQPQDLDVTLKFQLPESYPSSLPEVTVRSDSLTHGNNEKLVAALKDEALELLGQPMLKKLLAAGTEWVRNHGIRPGKTVNANAEVYLCDGKKTKPRKTKQKKKKGEEEEDDAKKPSMKTADDVIKRIMWDGELDADDFLVGYLDRFKGIQEKYFSAFSWEDIATVDYDVLAVPKHRIEYFKYRQVKIWDKPSRTDNVFGSTGSGLTVYDVIKNYKEPSVAEAAAASNVQSTTHGSSQSENDDSEDDSDDGITVTIGSSANIGTKESNVDTGEEEGTAYNPYWQDKMRPNYFLALRITDPEIKQGMQQIQDYILDQEERYAPCCIPPAALHITLLTLGLDTPEQVSRAKEVLHRLQPELANALPKNSLRLEGVSHFYNRVVYAKVQTQPELMAFVDHLRLLVKEAGLEIRDNHDFVPHVTIMKTTRPVSRVLGTKNVSPWVYEGFSDMYFGRQPFNAVHLCSMGDERQEDGFYVCPAVIHFD